MAATRLADIVTAGERKVIAEAGLPFASHQRTVQRRQTDASRGDAQVADRAGGGVAIDCDRCWLDDAAVASSEDWRRVIADERLADVIGQFAVAWTDAAGRRHLARDGVGGRTQFYAVTDAGLVHARSVGALLAAHAIPRRLHLGAVGLYLATAYVPGRDTLVEGVHEVLPGEQVTWDPAARTLTRRQFWQLPAAVATARSADDLRDDLRARLERATRRLLPPAGAPVGATLSGGVDSSLVVALASRLHDGPVHTYSVSFGAGHADELAFSSLVARHCGTRHTILELPAATILHHLDETIALLSDPIGDPLTVPNALLFRHASREVDVVLNGEGGDPCFGGPKNQPMVLAELYAMPDGTRPSREASYLSSHLKCYDDFAQMLSPAMHDALEASPLESWLAELLADPRWPDYVARLQAMNIQLKGAHHILPKVDALSRPFGVVPRAPLFDRDVVALSLAIPPRLKLNGATEKYLLKEAVRDLLPEAIIARPKSGMLVPVESWLRGPMRAAMRERILDGLAPYGLFQRGYLERLVATELGGMRPRHGAKAWLLVTLEAWLRKVLAA